MRAVGSDDDHLRLALAESLQGGLVSEDSLSRLHDQLKSGVHVVSALLLYSWRKDMNVRYEEKIKDRPAAIVTALTVPNARGG